MLDICLTYKKVMKKKEIKKDEILKKGGKTASEFKEFIAKGNILDLAVGVVMGGAFGKIVTSVVSDILMPVIGMLIGGIDFSGLSVKVGEATITYGNFIQNIIDFLIISLFIFIFVKFIEKLTKLKKEEEKAEEEKKDEKQDEQIELLKEIRDLLKEDE